MAWDRLLIANRGEIALRIARACAELGLQAVAVHSQDDADALNVRRSRDAVALPGIGPGAYLDMDSIVGAALAKGCQAIHPGYGFLSESAEFARRCAAAGLVFVGAAPQTLDLLGDKSRARALARDVGVAVPKGTWGATSRDEAHAFFATLAPGSGMMVKALSGGGGRGMRVVRQAGEIAEAFASGAAEALAAMGDGALYVEELIPAARHIEVQVAGDGLAAPVVIGERDCSLQRRHQKLVEIAPAQNLAEAVRQQLANAAASIAATAGLRGLATMEFLVHADAGRFVFIEANPRLQVEHTVTEQAFGIDLVKLQIRLAMGRGLADAGLNAAAPPRPKATAIQCRVNMETFEPGGAIGPALGRLTTYEPPAGPGIRVDGQGFSGFVNNGRFDSLLAKLVVFSLADEGFDVLVGRARRALSEFTVAGIDTNIGFLDALLAQPDVLSSTATTRFIDEHLADLTTGLSSTAAVPPSADLGENEVAVNPPMSGVVVDLLVDVGDIISPGQAVAIIEAMKMQSPVISAAGGRVVRIAVRLDQQITTRQAVCVIEAIDGVEASASAATAVDLDLVRRDLAELRERKALLLDAARPDVVAKRHGLGKRTARENLQQLCDEGSFIEYGGLAVAAQRSRYSVDHLMRHTPADGVITGIGLVNGEALGPENSSCVVVVYDYTVLAGTQGYMNHKKQERMFNLAAKLRRPIIVYAEGGGGRPGDTDKDLLVGGGVGGSTFATFGRLSGLVPTVAVVSGRCFAGNAALAGSCDVIIATEDANLGMAGPAMIEGGGMGFYRAEEVGPARAHAAAGSIDVLVSDEREATDAARKYVSYFQGDLPEWSCADQRLLRQVVPENRKMAFDVRALIHTLADEGSVMELRPLFGSSLVTALVRVEGRPMGLVANDPKVMGGALDGEASIKGARLAKLCDAFGLPLIALVDTPGFMVGPEAEADAFVRKACGLFVTGANVDIPIYTVITRRAYGLGAQATAGGHLLSSAFCVAWPTGELGGMGFEGAVRLAFRKELAAIEDPAERRAEFDRRVNEMYMSGRALNAASVLELDDVIDPADTRRWIMGLHHAIGRTGPRRERRYRSLGTW